MANTVSKVAKATSLDDAQRTELIFVMGARIQDVREWKEERWRYFYFSIIAIFTMTATTRIPGASISPIYKAMVCAAVVLILLAWRQSHRATEVSLSRAREALENMHKLLSSAVEGTRSKRPKQTNAVPLFMMLLVYSSSVFALVAIGLSAFEKPLPNPIPPSCACAPAKAVKPGAP